MAAPRSYLLTADIIEDHYHRWREVMKAVALHDGLLAGNPVHQPFYFDLFDRLREDPWWTNSPTGNKEPGEFMMWHPGVPDDLFLIWTKIAGLQTPTMFFGPTGFGRLQLRPISVEGVRPWSTADIPEGEAKPIIPDGQEEPL